MAIVCYVLCSLCPQQCVLKLGPDTTALVRRPACQPHLAPGHLRLTPRLCTAREPLGCYTKPTHIVQPYYLSLWSMATAVVGSGIRRPVPLLHSVRRSKARVRSGTPGSSKCILLCGGGGSDTAAAPALPAPGGSIILLLLLVPPPTPPPPLPTCSGGLCTPGKVSSMPASMTQHKTTATVFQDNVLHRAVLLCLLPAGPRLTRHSHDPTTTALAWGRLLPAGCWCCCWCTCRCITCCPLPTPAATPPAAAATPPAAAHPAAGPPGCTSATATRWCASCPVSIEAVRQLPIRAGLVGVPAAAASVDNCPLPPPPPPLLKLPKCPAYG